MLLTITTDRSPATDLGYLLHKHPDKHQTFSLPWGTAHVFYPEATAERCTAALMVDVDPVNLVRGSSGNNIEQYVNDRPYAASSFLSVAISSVFRTALKGTCDRLPELVATAIPLTVTIASVPDRGNGNLLKQLFAPLGYEIAIEGYPLDEEFPSWGKSDYHTVTLTHTIELSQLLSHLYVLIPVLDNDKHYWVGGEEVDKLLRHGEGWLATHPAKESIVYRYLKRQGKLSRDAISQLTIVEDKVEAEAIADEGDREEEKIEKPIALNQQRLEKVIEVIREVGASRIVDLGCGEGKLLRLLMKEKQVTELLGVDVTHRSLEIAAEKLNSKYNSDRQQAKVTLVQGSLVYRDRRIAGYDAATVIEVIEHMDLFRLATFERVLFEFARPKYAIVTTPNREYNIKFANLPQGKLRHRDHRFEWTRSEFQTWANRVADRFSYRVSYRAIGDVDIDLGGPTQMALFESS
jgi:3' terminal RNA ribose 2'-O-methyltransferase Hen1